MKHHTHTFAGRTTSADLMLSYGFSIAMHALILLVDPLASFSVSDRLKEQPSGIIMVNLKVGADAAQRNSVRRSLPTVVKKGSHKKEVKSKAPRKTAKPVSPVQKPVRVAKAPPVERAPVPPKPAPVKALPPPQEAAPKAEEVRPAPPEKKVTEPYQPPVIEPDEDITVTKNLKPKPEIVKPVEKPPVPQEVPEPVKPEAPPPVPVAAAPVEPEEKPAEPVKEAPAQAEEQPVVAPVQEVQEPIKPEAPPVVAAAAEPEERPAAPVKEEPAKAAEQPAESPAPKEAQQSIPPSARTDEVKAEGPPAQSAKPAPVTAGPPDGKKQEKEKSGTDQTKAAAVVKKRFFSLSLLKRFAINKDYIRIGAPVGKPKIKITTPAVKKSSSKVQEISGWVKGNGITRVILSINGDSVTVPVVNDKFHWDGALIDGKNTITATAWDRNRYSATDQVIVEALPPRNGFALSLEEPGAGEAASPVITVRGRVGDSSVDSVRLIVNREFIEAAVENGSFEKTVLFREGENSLQAEAVNEKGASARTSVRKVMVTNRSAPDFLVRLFWEDLDSDLRVKVARKKRDHLDDEQGAVSAVEASALMSAHEGYREKIFAVYDAKAGAYLLSVTGGKKTRCLLSVTIPSKRKTRLFGPVLIEEEGTFIGRLLMPEGIYWDEDEWFSGQIENGDSITKYNSPEGMTWKEMK